MIVTFTHGPSQMTIELEGDESTVDEVLEAARGLGFNFPADATAKVNGAHATTVRPGDNVEVGKPSGSKA